jgi:hypothetical protein
MAESETQHRDPETSLTRELRDQAAVARASRRRGLARVRLGAVLAVAIAAGFIAWAAIGGSGGGGSSSPPKRAGTGPVALSYGGLRTLAGVLGQPIYWVGRKPGAFYELRQTSEGKAYVRYLPAGVKAGDPRPLLTIGTYPMTNAFSVTRAAARGPGSTQLQTGNGAVAFQGRASKTNAYVAFPGSRYQIEVYSPVPGQARSLVTSGAVRPVRGGSPVGQGAEAVSPAALVRLAKHLGQPIYWAGRRAGSTYEVTQASSGRIYVRYLPKGVKVGTPGVYLTIGTYPVAGALRVTQGLGKRPGYTSLRLRGGVIAAFGKKRATTTNVYVAYPGADYQIEVFDPTAGDALKLVRSGRIAAIR